MKTEGMVQEAGTGREANAETRAQLAQHLAQQPESRRTFDKWMKVLEAAGLALIAGHLAWAIYVSFNWGGMPQQIGAVWFALPATIAAVMALLGVHAAGIRAFFPIVLPGSSLGLDTGSKAVGMGVGFAVVLLVVAAFWGTFAWGVWTANWAILEPLLHILGVGIGLGVAVAVVQSLYRQFRRFL